METRYPRPSSGPHTLKLLAVTCCLAGFFHHSVTATPVLHTDIGIPNTVIVRNYLNGSEGNIVYQGPTPAPGQTLSGGASSWTYSTGGGDPQIVYNDGAGTYDHAAYPWVRMRYQQNRAAQAQAWENPAQGGEFINFPGSLSMSEVSGNPDSTVNAPVTPDGSGIRFDPFPNAVDGDVFTADYLMLDRFQTIGLGEWDRAGDQQGWATPNISGASVANSLLRGTSTGDSQVTSGPGFDADSFKYIQIRLKTSGSLAQVFWGTGGAYVAERSINLGNGDGEYHTYLIDFSNEPTWNGANMTVRLDPVSGGAANTFELDYIRASTGAMIPEPSSVVLLGLGGLALLTLRRRLM